MTASDVPTLATGLARRWQGLRRRHVAIAFGCACGAPVGHVSLTDLEGDILVYLHHRYPPGCDPGIDAIFPPDCVDAGGTLAELLQRMAELTWPETPVLLAFTAELERSIASYERSAMGRTRRLRADAGD